MSKNKKESKTIVNFEYFQNDDLSRQFARTGGAVSSLKSGGDPALLPDTPHRSQRSLWHSQRLVKSGSSPDALLELRGLTRELLK